MAITPNTDLLLIKCPLELDNNNQITFSSASAQSSYFANLPHLRVTNIQYQRKDGIIRYPAHIDTLLEYNYVMYRNNNYSSKYFYAYITRMEYVNDNMTHIYIKTDVYQTWMFDLEYKSSFVDREHTNNDAIGRNLVDEGLELGDFVVNGTPVDDSTMKDTIICLASTTLSDGSIQNVTKKGKLVDGLVYYLFNVNGDGTEAGQQAASDGLTALKERIRNFANNGYLDNIIAIFSAPSSVWNGYNPKSSTERLETSLKLTNTIIEINRNTSINGYTPKNNKLFTSPFNFIMVDNNSGAMSKYSYEYFDTPSKPAFNLRIAPSIGSSSQIIPYGYKNTTENNFSEALSGGKYATCAWTGDAYTNWLTQNSLNLGMNSISSIGQILLGGTAIVLGQGLVGASILTGGIGGILGNMQQKHQASFMPPQADTNTTSGDVPNVFGKNTFTFYNMSIRSEMARKIDSFFSMYGYKTNELKVPNTTGRRNWNYVKTINANIEALIPQEDLQEIKNMFDNGVTLWHNPATFLDYSQNNAII